MKAPTGKVGDNQVIKRGNAAPAGGSVLLVTMSMRMVVSTGMVVGVIMAAAAIVAMGVIMVMMMALRSVFMGMVVLPMIVIVSVDLAMTVGPAFGIESGKYRRHRGAEPLQHVLDDMIVANAQPVAEELDRQMAVAEVPGDADDLGRPGSGDLQQALGHRLDQDQPAVLEFERIAVLHDSGFLEIEQKHRLADAAHDEAAAVAIVAFEGERIGRRAGPGAGGEDAGSGDHDMSVLADGGKDVGASLAKSVVETRVATIKAKQRRRTDRHCGKRLAKRRAQDLGL